MIIRKCDRCEAVFYPSSNYKHVSIPVRLDVSRRSGDWRDVAPMFFGMVQHDMDLCEKCAKELEELIAKWLPAQSASKE